MDTNFKKKLAILFNEINKEIFGLGVQEQKLEIMDNKIVILAKTKRISALEALTEEHHELVLALDAALSKRYKKRLLERVESELAVKTSALFRDYDVSNGVSCVVICLEN